MINGKKLIEKPCACCAVKSLKWSNRILFYDKISRFQIITSRNTVVVIQIRKGFKSEWMDLSLGKLFGILLQKDLF